MSDIISRGSPDARARVLRRLSVVAAALALTVAVAAPAAADSVTTTITGAGGSTTGNNVAVSPDGSTVYAANGAASGIAVIDAATNTVTGTITTPAAPTSVVVSPDGSRLYATIGSLNSVLVVDTATASTVTTVTVGNQPIGIAISPDGSRVYAANVNSPGSVSVINATTNTLISSIPVSSPRNLIVSPNGSRVYVGQYSATNFNVAVIDTATNTVATTITGAASADTVVGFAFSPDGSRLYGVTRGNGIRVIDTTSATVVGAINIDAATNNAAGIAVAPDGTRAYVTDGAKDRIVIVDLAASDFSEAIAVGDNPTGVRITPDGLHAYVNNATARTVSVIALDTFPAITTATLPDSAYGSSYSATVASTGSPAPQVTVASGALPPGLTLDPVTGALTGIPTATGSYAFSVVASSTVSGIASTATKSYTIVIAAVPPSVPLSLTATVNGTGVALAWTAPATTGGSPVTGYRIERSVTGGAFTTLVADTGSPATTHTDTTVTAGQSYSYRVAAITAAGAGNPSAPATAAVPAVQPISPAPAAAPLAFTGSDPSGSLAAAAALIVVGLALSAGTSVLGRRKGRVSRS